MASASTQTDIQPVLDLVMETIQKMGFVQANSLPEQSIQPPRRQLNQTLTSITIQKNPTLHKMSLEKPLSPIIHPKIFQQFNMSQKMASPHPQVNHFSQSFKLPKEKFASLITPPQRVKKKSFSVVSCTESDQSNDFMNIHNYQKILNQSVRARRDKGNASWKGRSITQGLRRLWKQKKGIQNLKNSQTKKKAINQKKILDKHGTTQNKKTFVKNFKNVNGLLKNQETALKKPTVPFSNDYANPKSQSALQDVSEPTIKNQKVSSQAPNKGNPELTKINKMVPFGVQPTLHSARVLKKNGTGLSSFFSINGSQFPSKRAQLNASNFNKANLTNEFAKVAKFSSPGKIFTQNSESKVTNFSMTTPDGKSKLFFNFGKTYSNVNVDKKNVLPQQIESSVSKSEKQRSYKRHISKLNKTLKFKSIPLVKAPHDDSYSSQKKQNREPIPSQNSRKKHQFNTYIPIEESITPNKSLSSEDKEVDFTNNYKNPQKSRSILSLPQNPNFHSEDPGAVDLDKIKAQIRIDIHNNCTNKLKSSKFKHMGKVRNHSFYSSSDHSSLRSDNDNMLVKRRKRSTKKFHSRVSYGFTPMDQDTLKNLKNSNSQKDSHLKKGQDVSFSAVVSVLKPSKIAEITQKRKILNMDGNKSDKGSRSYITTHYPNGVCHRRHQTLHS